MSFSSIRIGSLTLVFVLATASLSFVAGRAVGERAVPASCDATVALASDFTHSAALEREADATRTGPEAKLEDAGFAHAEDPSSVEGPARAGLRSESVEAAIEALRHSQDEDASLQAVRRLWIAAADAGAPDSAIDALERMQRASDAGSTLELETERALDDLARLSQSEALPLDQQDRYAGAERAPYDWSGDVAEWFGAPPESREPADDSFEDLAPRFTEEIDDPDTAVRIGAVRGLSRFRRDEASQMLLGAAGDRDPGVRAEALHGLWLSAADGVDPGGDTRSALEYASTDPDDRVRVVAKRAIRDLDQLER